MERDNDTHSYCRNCGHHFSLHHDDAGGICMGEHGEGKDREMCGCEKFEEPADEDICSHCSHVKNVHERYGSEFMECNECSCAQFRTPSDPT